MGVGRLDLWRQLGVVMTRRRLQPLTEKAYKQHDYDLWKNDLDRNPHGDLWHTSFHASRFPGDSEKACGRQAMYELMGVPRAQPIDMRGRTIMDVGKAIEEHVVTRWHHAGLLLSDPPWYQHQMGFVLPKYWLTGNPDAILLHPETWGPYPHPVEVKGKDDDAVREMWRGQKTYDLAHKHQLLTYIGMLHELSTERWPLLPATRSGTLYYISRNRPYNTMEYEFEHDPNFMHQGFKRLEEWQGLWLRGELPPRDRSWKWTEPPCHWCPWKKLCRADIRANTTTIDGSVAIKHAKELLPGFDINRSREAIAKRWGTNSATKNGSAEANVSSDSAPKGG